MRWQKAILLAGIAAGAIFHGGLYAEASEAPQAAAVASVQGIEQVTVISKSYGDGELPGSAQPLFDAADTVSDTLRNLDLSASVDLGDGWSVVPHVGRQWVRHNSAYAYTDYALALNKDFGHGLSASAAVIGTNADKALYVTPSGRFTGAPTGIPSFQAGKIIRVEAWLESQGLWWGSFAKTWFYSDSHNDLPLMKKVNNPVAVDPDDTLRAHATAQGWPVISLR